MKQRFIFLLLMFSFINNAISQEVLLDIMGEELEREMQSLQKAEFPPYFIDYRVDDVSDITVSASFGSLTQSHNDRSRVLTTNVKVGDYTLDNTHEVAATGYGYNGNGFANINAILPLDDNALAVKQTLWRATTTEYENAIEAYKIVKNNTQVEGDGKKEVDDFSREVPVVHIEPSMPAISELIDQEKWEQKVKNVSAYFLNNPHLSTGSVSLSFSKEKKYYINTEGTKIVQNMTYAHMNISASILAEDGDILPLYKSYFAFLPSDLPNEDSLISDVKLMVEKLIKLREAPLAEPYSGPAILDARSAGVFFHEIFGHRIEGHRLKSEMDGQTFLSKVDAQVLDKSLTVISDPSLTQYGNRDLIGTYKYDDEGVEGQKVVVVENGILRNFLMSRSPLEKFIRSNGHGRASAGLNVVSRQSNLIIESNKPLSATNLRKKLIKECKKQGKEYGYLFSDVIGGFTNTDRFSANVFNVMPTEVYRVYVDGRPDQLVRGVDLIGTPLTMFAEIKAAGEQKEIFTGICGAESGNVPVSAIAPALYVRRIETQKKMKQNAKPSLLSRPGGSSPSITK